MKKWRYRDGNKIWRQDSKSLLKNGYNYMHIPIKSKCDNIKF